ncbi:MAG: hypothetical protein R3262_11240 [Xanthomarina gelatinilytica]|nr:hypothetical protein [Xanthomarina gelatinilytica]
MKYEIIGKFEIKRDLKIEMTKDEFFSHTKMVLATIDYIYSLDGECIILEDGKQINTHIVRLSFGAFE